MMPEPRLIPIVELTKVRLREFLREPDHGQLDDRNQAPLRHRAGAVR